MPRLSMFSQSLFMKESQKKRSHGEKRPRGRFMPGKVRITLVRYLPKTIAFFEETVFTTPLARCIPYGRKKRRPSYTRGNILPTSVFR